MHCAESDLYNLIRATSTTNSPAPPNTKNVSLRDPEARERLEGERRQVGYEERRTTLYSGSIAASSKITTSEPEALRRGGGRDRSVRVE